jgi:hypothetical protein
MTDEWVKKMYMDTMEYYSGTKNEIMLSAGKLMEQDITLNKISQVQKDKVECFPS